MTIIQIAVAPGEQADWVYGLDERGDLHIAYVRFPNGRPETEGFRPLRKEAAAVHERLAAIRKGATPTPEAPRPIPRADPVLTHFALCPACGSACIEEVLFVAEHLVRAHGWARDRIETWVRDVRAGRTP